MRAEVSTRLAALPGAEKLKYKRGWRRIAHRVGIDPANPRPVAPERPAGAKLELTYSCNLRCGFCYTDSPRRTLERPLELSDAGWQAVVGQAIELGIIEAVVTGGEPLLRKALALDLLDRLDAAGISSCLNTNGWFVDEAVAQRLAGLNHGTVHISLDGPTPEVHDRSRGVPGSWRRAVRAISLLLDRGVRVQAVHVATPDNAGTLAELIEQVWLLGVHSLRIAPVVPIGAAARRGGWAVRRGHLERLVDRARREFGDGMDLRIARELLPGDPVLAPAYLLVRPNGGVMVGSLSPFRFGHATEDGLKACWTRMRRDWNHPRIAEWREPLVSGKPLDQAPIVMYRDEDVDLETQVDAGAASLVPAPPVPAPAASTQVDGVGDLDAAHRHVRELALARRYRLGPVRWSPADHGARYVRLPSGQVSKLNAAAAMVMDACDDATPAAAVQALAGLSTAAAVPSLERDALSTARRLAQRGVLSPALGR